MSNIVGTEPEIKSSAQRRQKSSQGARNLARDFAELLAHGDIPNTPPSEIQPDVDGKAVNVADGHRVPIRSPWLRSRLSCWLDVVVTDNLAKGCWNYELPASGKHTLRVGRDVIDLIIDWMIAETWLSASAAVAVGASAVGVKRG